MVFDRCVVKSNVIFMKESCQTTRQYKLQAHLNVLESKGHVCQSFGEVEKTV